MGMVCAVAFQRHGRLYYADPGSLTPAIGDHVLYPTDAGPEVAEVMWAPQWVSEDVGGLPRVLRRCVELLEDCLDHASQVVLLHSDGIALFNAEDF